MIFYDLLRPVVIALCACAVCCAQTTNIVDEKACIAAWFGENIQTQSLKLARYEQPVIEVKSDAVTVGWVFRTDQVPPVSKGKMGPIVLLAGFDTQERIRGIHVVRHEETPKYFKRVTASFFAQFLNAPITRDPASFDVVTKATFSSKAIIREVVMGAANLAKEPEIKEQLRK